jgi:mitochondrial import receptor subunit TOM40
MFPVILGDVDSSGNLNANIIHAFSQNIRSKLVTQVGLFCKADDIGFVS